MTRLLWWQRRFHSSKLKREGWEWGTMYRGMQERWRTTYVVMVKESFHSWCTHSSLARLFDLHISTIYFTWRYWPDISPIVRCSWFPSSRTIRCMQFLLVSPLTSSYKLQLWKTWPIRFLVVQPSSLDHMFFKTAPPCILEQMSLCILKSPSCLS